MRDARHAIVRRARTHATASRVLPLVRGSWGGVARLVCHQVSPGHAGFAALCRPRKELADARHLRAKRSQRDYSGLRPAAGVSGVSCGRVRCFWPRQLSGGDGAPDCAGSGNLCPGCRHGPPLPAQRGRRFRSYGSSRLCVGRALPFSRQLHWRGAHRDAGNFCYRPGVGPGDGRTGRDGAGMVENLGCLRSGHRRGHTFAAGWRFAGGGDWRLSGGAVCAATAAAGIARAGRAHGYGRRVPAAVDRSEFSHLPPLPAAGPALRQYR